MNSAQILFIRNVVDNKVLGDNIVGTTDIETVNLGTSGNLVFEVDDNSITFPASSTTTFVVGAYLTVVSSVSNNKDFVIKSIDSTNSKKVYVVEAVVDETIAFDAVNLAVTQKLGVIEEYAPAGGTAAAKYQNRTIVLDSQSTGLRIMFAANVAPGSTFELYYRSGVNNVEDVTWKKVDVSFKEAANIGEYTEHEYSINNIQSFNAYQVKLVMRATNSALYPSFKDLRAIALA
jgi:hypothetical protein